jgi:hypothetical protein
MWRRYPVSRIGAAGGGVILLVVLSILVSGSKAAAAAMDTAPAEAGTVRVVDDAGKGDG